MWEDDDPYAPMLLVLFWSGLVGQKNEFGRGNDYNNSPYVVDCSPPSVEQLAPRSVVIVASGSSGHKLDRWVTSDDVTSNTTSVFKLCDGLNKALVLLGIGLLRC